MAEVVGLNINIDPDGSVKKATEGVQGLTNEFAEAIKAGKSARTVLREMKDELVAMELSGERGTEAYDQLSKSLADAQSRVGDLQRDLNLLKPDDRAMAFHTLGTTMVAGFQAGAGAMAVFTGNNEELNNILLKSMALIQGLQGLQAIVETKEQFAAIKTIFLKKQQAAATQEVTAATEGEAVATEVAAGAFDTLKGAIIATGIGALVVGLGLLIANFSTVKKWVGEVIDSLGGLKGIIQSSADAFRNAAHWLTFGLVDDAATHNFKEAVNDRITSLNNLKDSQENYYSKQEQNIRSLKLEGSSTKEVYEAEQALTKAKLQNTAALILALKAKGQNQGLNDAEKKQLNDLRVQYATFTNDLKQNEKDYTESVKKEGEERLAKRKAEHQKAVEEEKSYQQKMYDAYKEHQQEINKNEQDKIKIKEDFQKEFDDTFKTDQQKELDKIEERAAQLKSAGVAEIEITRWKEIEIQKVQDKYDQQEIEATQKYIDQKAKEQADAAAKELEAEQKKAEDKKKIQDAIFQSAQSSIDATNGLIDLTIKNEEKAAKAKRITAIAQVGLDEAKTLASVIAGAAAAAAAGGPAAPFLFASYVATGIASVITSFAKVKAILKDSSPSPAIDNGKGAASQTPQNFNSTENIIDKQYIANKRANKENNNTFRAYVLDHDLELSKQRMDRIAKLSTH